MRLTVDLHSHSGYSGGVGQISLPSVAATMRAKGIGVFGTGDCLQPDWRHALRCGLTEREPGLFALSGDCEETEARFLLQTEIIITASVPSGGRKGVHVVLLFPSFAAVEEVERLLLGWEVKIGMGRPFLKCENADDVASKLERVVAVDASILVIPAHVLTPQGIYGSDHPVDRLADFFGPFAEKIRAVETGLSADPEILALLPELDDRALLSNSDCHSAALNRVGREYTCLNVDTRSYDAVVAAILDRDIAYTGEFSPAEGRYFLTGHRAGKEGHAEGQFCYFSPDTVPEGNICPVCGAELTVGVLQRALELSDKQGQPRVLSSIKPTQKYVTMVPLVEVIAAALAVKNCASSKVLGVFSSIIAKTGTEETLWEMDADTLIAKLGAAVPGKVLDGLLSIINKEFTFDPLGYDGAYGELVLGKKGEWFGHKVISK